MSEYYGGDEYGYYDDDDQYHLYDGGSGGGGATGGNPYLGGSSGPLSGGPFGSAGPSGNSGGGGSIDLNNLPTNGTDWSIFNPSPGTITGYTPDGQPIYNTGTTFGTTVSANSGGGGRAPTLGPYPPNTQSPGGGSTSNSNSVTNNSQVNNTQNNSSTLAQSTALGATSPISSGVPTAAASSFKPNVISQGSLHEGQPPPMPTPKAQVPPSLHPEKPTDWANIKFGSADALPSQGNPASKTPQSTIGKIGSALGAVTGMGQAAKRYKGLYDAIHPPKAKTPEELQAEAYRQTYGL